MKQEIFKSMYNHIGLNKEQKDRIYKGIQNAKDTENVVKGVRLTTRAAAFAVIFLLSGMTVFAVNKLSLVERFAKAMNSKWDDEQLITQAQRGFYEQYGQVLGNEITTAYGTLKLEAVLYDDYFLIIPYTYTMNSGEDDYNEEAEVMSISDVHYSMGADSERIRNMYMKTDSIDAGIRTGSYILCTDIDKGGLLKQGETIKVSKWDTDNMDDSILSEFTLGEKADRINLYIDGSTYEALKSKGLLIEEMSVSPLSVSYSGISSAGTYAEITVVLKDGSEISSCDKLTFTDDNDGYLKENYPNSVKSVQMFNSPVKIDEVEGIRMKTLGMDIWIPVEDR